MIEWDNQSAQQLFQQRRLHPQQQMGEELQNRTVNGDGGGGAAGGVMYVKVMTDEQLETLRRQIAVYAEICEQLVEAHKNLTAQQDLAGGRLGNLYSDPFMAGGHKITSRQRWTPTPMQLQILERAFDQGNGTPSKQKIKDITAELSEHGQISETNVYNWFQNRRARSKRKQQNPASNNHTTESEAEAEVESAKETKTKAEDLHSQTQHNSASSPDLLCLHNSEICHADMQQYLDPQLTKVDTMISSDGVLEATSLEQLPMFDGILSNSGNEYLTDEMELPENYNLFQQAGN